ncbi:UNKNOWN [Stylonychia lemnae]|uniref:Uncharacterized protein n=1 Tax=Stylonychia lemnae TaxID=5949 RepID=A0A077ZUC6_STYLE|nr:UNKNOWN [Stylonychia lemnae]|eukprot:CDW72071.1 UNKNOWN [Stylonychia lemnae]
MDIILVFFVPVALIRNFFSSQKRQRIKHKALAILCICVFLGLFAIAYVLFFNYVEIPNDKEIESFFTRVQEILLSSNAQLEFLTLIGIIMNAFMQGYVCTNTIYVYFIEDIYQMPSGTNCEGGKSQQFEFHQQRIQNTLDQIAYYKKKQLKMQFELKKLSDKKQDHQKVTSADDKVIKFQQSIEMLKSEIANYEKEIKMLNTLQKQYTQDVIEYMKWSQQINYRQTYRGKFFYLIGRATALFWIFKFYQGVRNMIWSANYLEQSNSNFRQVVLKNMSFYKEEDELFWDILIQYTTIFVIGAQIALNIQSFMRNLLTSLKNILKDYSIKTSYNTTILIFTFVRFPVYI